jgi:hypothetical protein
LFEKGAGLVNPLEFPNLVHNAPAGYASIALGAAADNVTTCQEELAGDHAVAAMAERIAHGNLDAALAAGGDLASASLDAAYRAIAPGETYAPASVLGALLLESTDACRARSGTAWARIVASAGAGREGGMRAAVDAVLARNTEPVDVWLSGAVSAADDALDRTAAAHPKLTRAERLEARRLLGNACAAGTAVIALGSAFIAAGRAKTVLVTSMTRDGQVHVTLLAKP